MQANAVAYRQLAERGDVVDGSVCILASGAYDGNRVAVDQGSDMLLNGMKDTRKSNGNGRRLDEHEDAMAGAT